MARGRFVPWTAAEVTPYFLGLGFEQKDLPGCGEMVFERPVKTEKTDFRVAIRVYTAVGKHTGESRECGSDAARVILVDQESGRPVWSATKTLRTASYLENLAERCREAWKAAVTLKACPACSGRMVMRRTKETKEAFWGCIKFPACRGTRAI